MDVWFYILALLTVASAVAAMNLRNLVHCALALALTFVGLAMLYLQLDAQFVGWVQILVYVGAVAILIVFAILLTRGGDTRERTIRGTGWLTGAGIAAFVFSAMAMAVMTSATPPPTPTVDPGLTVQAIGNDLMQRYVLPLEVIALLLTAALIGAVLMALTERTRERPGTTDS